MKRRDLLKKMAFAAAAAAVAPMAIARALEPAAETGIRDIEWLIAKEFEKRGFKGFVEFEVPLTKVNWSIEISDSGWRRRALLDPIIKCEDCPKTYDILDFTNSNQE